MGCIVVCSVFSFSLPNFFKIATSTSNIATAGATHKWTTLAWDYGVSKKKGSIRNLIDRCVRELQNKNYRSQDTKELLLDEVFFPYSNLWTAINKFFWQEELKFMMAGHSVYGKKMRRKEVE